MTTTHTTSLPGGSFRNLSDTPENREKLRNLQTPTVDALIAKHTAFTSLLSFVLETAPSYVPSLTPRLDRSKATKARNAEIVLIADAFDKGCEVTGQTRRAYRG